ncbi:MAG: hypothetical protein RR086_04175, partial [Clostridia bacterium]
MNITKAKYKAIDLLTLAVILAICEALNALLVSKINWFKTENYCISLFIPIVLIVMMRWNGFSAIHAVLAGLIYCACLEASWQAYLIYAIGNCFILLDLILFKIIGKSKIRNSVVFTTIFVLCGYLLAEVGRGLVAVILGNPFSIIISYLATDSLSAIIGLIIVLIARKQDGMFEDQILYLTRVQKEKQLE